MQWSQGTTYPPPNNNWIINSSLGCLLQYTCMHTPLLPEQSHISIDSTCFQVILIRNAGTRPTFPASCVEPISPQDPFKRQEPPRGNANTSADTVIPCNFQVCYCSVLTSGTIYTPFICNEKKKRVQKTDILLAACEISQMSRCPLTGSHVVNGGIESKHCIADDVVLHIDRPCSLQLSSCHEGAEVKLRYVINIK